MICEFDASRAATTSLLAWTRPWGGAFLLLLPVWLLYFAHFMISGAAGTGFVQYDQAYYMADARAYFADSRFTPAYGLPFSPDPTTPRIYFQPLTLALGLIRRFTGADPGILYATAGFVLAICCARIITALYRQIVGLDRPAALVGLVCFFWGGGAITLAGMAYGLKTGEPAFAHVLDADPFNGFWFLNLGRNLIYPVEAFYHLVFFGSVLFVLRRRFAAALACAVLLSASHPFSGLQLIAVLLACSVIERLIRAEDRPPSYFPAALLLLGLCHVGYYLGFLDYASGEHRVLQKQWSLPWDLPIASALAAYGPVAFLAAAAIVNRWRYHHSLTVVQRFLLIWAAVSFVLANHNLLIAPVQPLHFTRGYIWTPLFLLGAPALLQALEAASRRDVVQLILPAVLIGFLLLDNAVWFLVRASPNNMALILPAWLSMRRSGPFSPRSRIRATPVFLSSAKATSLVI